MIQRLLVTLNVVLFAYILLALLESVKAVLHCQTILIIESFIMHY